MKPAHVDRAPHVCLIGASLFVDDPRMFYRAAITLSTMYDVSVVAAGKTTEVRQENGLTLTSYRFDRRKDYPALLISIFSHLLAKRYDVVYCFDLESLMITIAVSRLTSTRPVLIYDAHEHYPSMMAAYVRLPPLVSKVVEGLIDFVEKQSALSCDGIVTVSPILSDTFRNIGPKPIVVIRNVQRLRWARRVISSANRRSLRLDEISKPIVVSLGTLTPSKGLDTIISAKRYLESRGVDCCFLVVGRVKGIRDYRRFSSDDFRFLPWLDFNDVPMILKMSSVGLALSKPVTYNQRIAENERLFCYMIEGVPVVASDMPGMRGLLQRVPFGLLVDPYDISEISEAITTLLTNDRMRASMSRTAREAAERRFNWELEGRELLAFFRKLLHEDDTGRVS